MYFIFDCLGNIVGNPRGYRTLRGAKIQQDSPKSKANIAIVKAVGHCDASSINPKLLSQIKWIETGNNVKQDLVNNRTIYSFLFN